MLNILIKTILVCSLALNLYANVTSLAPQKNAINVPADIKIQITFDNPIVSSSIKKNTIKLKKDDKKINGELSTKDTNTLIFTPNEKLKTGIYSLHVKSIKLKNPEPIKPKTWYQKLIFKICSLFYSDVRECKLYQRLFGNNDIKTKSIKYSFSVNDNIPTIETLNLETSQVELKENSQANLTLKATYTDGAIKDITNNIEWTIQDNSIVSINNTTLKALKEGTTTLSAKVDNITSNIITITVYKEINGYKLPPEPDETLNNSTLLGIDSNNNGVRDDVERKIINKYKAESIKIEVQMIDAKIQQETLDNPIGNAIAIQKKNSKIGDCVMYLLDHNVEFNNRIEFIENTTYNTKQRVKAYLQYNQALSGGVYGGPISDENAQACDFDVEQMLEDRK